MVGVVVVVVVAVVVVVLSSPSSLSWCFTTVETVGWRQCVWGGGGGGGGGGVSHPGTSQRLGRSDLPLQGRNLLAWSADTPCTHHAPDTHGLVEGHVRAHTLRQYLFIIYYSNV